MMKWRFSNLGGIEWGLSQYGVGNDALLPCTEILTED